MNDNPPPVNAGPTPPPMQAPMIEPPPAHANYTRGVQFVGSPDHLEALADGYFGLNWAFLFTALWLIFVIIVVALVGSNSPPESALTGVLILVMLLLTIPVVAYISYKPLSRLAFGLNWKMSPTALAILFPFAVGMIGIFAYIVPQIIASSEITKYGIKGSFFGGFRKKQIKEVAAAMRNSPQYQAYVAQQGQPLF